MEQSAHHHFENPKKFAEFVTKYETVPLSFSISVSDVVSKVFYMHFIEEGCGYRFVETVQNLPQEIRSNWLHECDDFESKLLGGRFEITTTNYEVMDYLFLHAVGTVNEDEKAGVELCLDLFDVEITKPCKKAATELYDLLTSLDVAQPYIKRKSHNLVYAGNTEKYMRYVG